MELSQMAVVCGVTGRPERLGDERKEKLFCLPLLAAAGLMTWRFVETAHLCGDRCL